MLPAPVTQRGGGSGGLKGLSLAEKLRRSWKGEEIDPKVTRMSDTMSSFCFWFVAVTELYVILGYVIPYRFRDWDPMSRYYLKVFACYVFVQSMANWLCVRCYTSLYRVTADQPDLTKQLWDEYPTEVVANGKMSPRTDPNQDHNNDSQTDRYFASSAANLSLHWHYCYGCQMKVPPRAHHCKICKACVLRRDHHCYMTGVCIGHRNLRYFIVMNFYIAIASIYGLYEIVMYLGDVFYPHVDFSYFFLPKTIFIWFMYDDDISDGGIPTEVMLMVIHCYFLWWTGFTAVGFFTMQMFVTSLGTTSHESMNRVPVRSSGSMGENFREIFGALWGFNFFWPSQIIFRQMLDGTHWPNLKPDRNKLIHNLRDKMRDGKVNLYDKKTWGQS